MRISPQTHTAILAKASSNALAITIVIASLVLSACSSSGSDSSGAQVSAVADNTEASGELVSDASNTSVLSDSISDVTSTNQLLQDGDVNIVNTQSENEISGANANSENLAISEPAGPNSDVELPDSNIDNVGTQEPNETVPDKVEQSTTTVKFDVTVPAYQSNALQVKISWGDTSINAQWIRDESWSAEADLPSNVEDTLVVLFNDNNGDITLGSVETSLTTDTIAEQSIVVSADQFNLTGWDEDTDGVSNFSESAGGSDPYVDEHSSLEIIDKLVWPQSGSVGLISWLGKGFEDSIPVDRPYYEHHEEKVPRQYGDWGTLTNTDSLTIDIDENGTGTYGSFVQDRDTPSDSTTVIHSATRTNTGQAITWVGEYSRYNSGVAVLTEYDLDTVISVNDDGSYTHSGDIYYYDNCCSHDRRTVTYTVTGSPINDTGYCSLTTGTITFTANLSSSNETTLFKATDDTYWRAKEFDRNGELVDRYFVDLIDTSFYCDYQELK